MLRSLTEVVKLAGHSGILITVDNLEILLNKSSLEPMHYTKLKREDTYESIRFWISSTSMGKSVRLR